jgi:hypothetical protein
MSRNDQIEPRHPCAENLREVLKFSPRSRDRVLYRARVEQPAALPVPH